MVVDLTPVQTLSWKEKLLGKGYLDQKGVSEATSLEVDDDFVLLDDDIKRSFVNDIPSIEFLARINQLLIKDMSTSNSKDYEKVLSQGPWIIYGQYLTVQPWTMEFNHVQPYPSIVMT
ncbi:hypothetical protein Goarm_000966 [Gossypium armourianum]|uniref:DUF4283 domain-containing protein n=1 Tax=Gossypium armourianum TaxID=34283 RepID=A0A7J9KBG8_9ROSI|nr:hypothetical protein [Gossypium armourianum]